MRISRQEMWKGGIADAKAGEAKKLQGLKLEDVWRVPVDSSGFVARKGKIQEELKRIAEERTHGNLTCQNPMELTT